MIVPTKMPVAPTKLHCQWVDEEPFEIKPGLRPIGDEQGRRDTAFLLKPRVPDRAAGTSAVS